MDLESRIQPQHEDEFNNEKNARFVRAPSYDYLARALGVTYRMPDDQLINIIKLVQAAEEEKPTYHLSYRPQTKILHSTYFDAARIATDYLATNIESDVENEKAFQELIESYGEQSTYTITDKRTISGTFRPRSYPRFKSYIPLFIFESLNKFKSLPDQPGEEFSIRPNRGATPLPEALTELREKTKIALKERSLDAAIEALFTMEEIWLWDNGHSSRSMNYFNVLLEKLGYKPISHGVVDLAAAVLTQEDFSNYVKYIVTEIEGQTLRTDR